MRRIATLWLAFAAFLISDPSAADQQLKHQLQVILDASSLPSLAYAIVEDGEITHVEQIHRVDVPQTTGAFRAGSLSKTVTTLLILSLIEDGLLDLQTEVRAILPQAKITNPWAESAPLRLVHLLEQTSGLPGTSYADYAGVAENYAPTDYARNRAHTLRWPPGRYFSYANGNHTIAAAMAEAVTGQSFDILMRERIFTPLGMTSSSFELSDPVISDLMTSYDAKGREERNWHLSVRPSGGLVAPIEDLAKLLEFLAGPRDGPVSAERVRQLRHPTSSLAARDGYKYIYGLGYFGFVAADQVFWGHWGRIDGYQTTLGTLPGTERGFVMVANGADRRGFQAAREALAAYTARDLPHLQPLPEIHGIQTDDFIGTWEPFTDDNVLRAWISGMIGLVRLRESTTEGRLLAVSRLGQKHELIPVAPAQFVSDGFPIVSHVFSETPEGEYFMLGDGQLTYRKLGAFEAAVKAVLPWFALSVCLAAFGFCVWGAVKIVRQGITRLPLAAFVLGIGAITLVALQVLHVAWGMLAPLSMLENLARPSAASLTLALLSVLWPTLTLVALGLSASSYAPGQRAISMSVSAVAVGLLSIAVCLFFQGWLPLVTWRS